MERLASASIGAIWSCWGPDFGTRGVLERFRQLAPKVFFYVDAYRYGGKHYDRTAELRDIRKGLDTVQYAIQVPYAAESKQGVPAGNVRRWDELMDQPRIAAADFAGE